MKHMNFLTDNGCSVNIGAADTTVSDGATTKTAPSVISLDITDEDEENEVHAWLTPEQAAGLAQALEMAAIQVLKKNHGMKAPF